MVSPAYVILSPKKGVSSKFFDYWFQNQNLLHQLWAYSHGLTNDRLRLYYQDFAKIPLALPDLPGQERIAAVLDATSRKVGLLTDKKNALEDYKRGLMQRLFSRELRFTQDDGSAFVFDGRLEIDSNAVERCIRGIALTKKNSLFAGPHETAEVWATYYSLIESARLNKVNPRSYLNWVVQEIERTRGEVDYGQLMPWHCPAGSTTDKLSPPRKLGGDAFSHSWNPKRGSGPQPYPDGLSVKRAGLHSLIPFCSAPACSGLGRNWNEFSGKLQHKAADRLPGLVLRFLPAQLAGKPGPAGGGFLDQQQKSNFPQLMHGQIGLVLLQQPF